MTVAGSAPVVPWLRPVAGGVEIETWVVPGASRSAVTGEHDGRVRLAVAAPPEGGRANRVVAALLAGLCGVPAGQVRLRRGGASRAKTWLVATDGSASASAEVTARLVAVVRSCPAGRGGADG